MSLNVFKYHFCCSEYVATNIFAPRAMHAGLTMYVYFLGIAENSIGRKYVVGKNEKSIMTFYFLAYLAASRK